ncbi:phenoloxidase-activating factor 2-like isoform X2 [Tigriopus californicus]|uniref:phenoloxidase-activating factor 2-like isoform X2 n=1 Tax=Tigriopus californicus TaxID=6832 RepID=UPI0027DAA2F9|nr:phenoloxidase-activating factor 2-like isoform X2 [Tigriopus californicus]
MSPFQGFICTLALLGHFRGARSQSNPSVNPCPTGQECTPLTDCFEFVDPNVRIPIIEKDEFPGEIPALPDLETSCPKENEKCCDKLMVDLIEPCEKLPNHQCISFAECSQVRGGRVEVGVRNTDDRCNDLGAVCCNLDVLKSGSNDTADVIPKAPITCGVRKLSLDDREEQFSAGRKDSQFGEWPHMCAIFWIDRTAQKFICGGSLISPEFVLTAAHCTIAYQTKSLLVRCGDSNLQDEREPAKYQESSIRTIVYHPRYNANNLENDFVVIQLEKELNLTEHIGTICLPEEPGDISYTEDQCFASGWGTENLEEGLFQAQLKHVKLPLIPFRKCENLLRKTSRLSDTFRLHRSFVCAGGVKDEDTCKGDGGGPLVCPSTKYKGRYVQVGITSWGIGCGDEDVPGAYAFVRSGICFIRWTAHCLSAGRVEDYIELGVCKDFLDLERNGFQSELEGVEIALQKSAGDARREVILANMRSALRLQLSLLEKLPNNCDFRG